MKFYAAAILAALASALAPVAEGKKDYFQRIASFPICSQIDETCDNDMETVAEIVVASKDGKMLIYTDSEQEQLGFVDIYDPYYPKPAGVLALGGEPTSVAVCGDYAIVCVNTSEDFINTSGKAMVIKVADQTVVREMDLGGQPDSIGVSPDCTRAVVAIENERDEDLGDGRNPQMPAGFVVVIDISEEYPADWSATTVHVTGLDGVTFPEDPEPEYVSINEENIAVVTLQENNAMVLIDAESNEVIGSFSAGEVDLENVDATEEDPALISQTESLSAVKREPDGVAWIDDMHFATADEGDLDGGSRGFTIFNKHGDVVYSSGNMLEHLVVSIGQYPDDRSGNKGNEPENIAVGKFGKDKLLFVVSERSSVVFVFDVKDPYHPEYIQVLPAGVGPEGAYAIEKRDLLVVASEVDDRGDKIRSVINIYERDYDEPSYPTIMSTGTRDNGTPIPFSALSGLAACPKMGKKGGKKDGKKGGKKGGKKEGMMDKKGGKKEGKRRGRHLDGHGMDDMPHCPENTLFAIEDSFYAEKRVLTIDTSYTPAAITMERYIMDSDNVFQGALDVLAGQDDESTYDTDGLITGDGYINVDLEGIAYSQDGGFWLVHEGRGTVGDDSRPVETPNILFKVDEELVITDVITLPKEINDIQLRFGFEGVAESNDGMYAVVAFQRAWGDEPNPFIGLYNTNSGEWKFHYYPLDEPMSQNGGWVGLSDITAMEYDGYFLVIERDNQGGPDAALKKLYKIYIDFDADGYQTLEKELVMDLLPVLKEASNGPVVEKLEGLAIGSDGYIYIVNDNDGVDDNSGETLFLNLGKA